MKNKIDIYINDNYGYDINSNRSNINKEEITNNFKKAYNYKGCKNILKQRDEHGIKYIIKFDTLKDYNIIIPTSSIKTNKQMIKELNTICKMMKLKKKKINKIKMKKVFMRTCIILAGAFVLKYTAEKVVERDNENFEREYEESGSIEMQQNLKMQQNHKEAIEQYYEDQKIEEQQLQQQINELETQQEQFNQQQTQKMIDDMEQYRNLDTMPFVTPLEESEQKLR